MMQLKENFDTFVRQIVQAYGVLFPEMIFLTWYKQYLEQDALDAYDFILALNIPDRKG
jgi:hypothetical protein